MIKKSLWCVVAAILLVSLLLTGCGPSAFKKAPCQFEVPLGIEIQCGYLSVPANRGRRASPMIRLHVAIVKPLDSHQAPDPVVILNGGPGNYTLANINFWLYAFGRIEDKRTLIIFDQRGVGYSQPSLSCPEVKKQWQQDWTENLSMQVMDEHEATALQVCHDRLVAQGVNVSAYTTAENATDVKDLRKALGYSKWNLYGGAYGSRLALEVMRVDPGGIRSVILDSAYPPQVDFYGSRADNFQRSIKLLFAHCASSRDCNRSYPDLGKKFYDLVDQLNRQPKVYELYNLSTGAFSTTILNGDRWIWAASHMFYGTGHSAKLIKRISTLQMDSTFSFGTDLKQIISINTGLSEGTYYSIQCADGIPLDSPQLSKDANAGLSSHFSEVLDGRQLAGNCSAWGVTRPDPRAREAVRSDIPTLILAGELDPFTPPAWGQLAAKTLSRSQFLEFPGFGHGVLGGGRDGGNCTFQIMKDFLEAPTAVVDASCIQSLDMSLLSP